MRATAFILPSPASLFPGLTIFAELKKKGATPAAPLPFESQLLSRSRERLRSVLMAFETPKPQQIERAAVAVDDANAGMPAPRNEAQDCHAREFIAGIFIAEID